MIKKVKTKGEAIQLLKVHMQNAENIMRNIIKVQQSNGQKKKIFTLMTEWLNTISTVTNEKIRETLYNIEQFRPDVVNLTSAGAANSSTAVTQGNSN
jgi:hypothetical protein